MNEAMDAGVVYEKEKEVIKEVEEDDTTNVIDYEKIISGHVVKEVEVEKETTDLGSFFKRVFARISFWG